MVEGKVSNICVLHNPTMYMYAGQFRENHVFSENFIKWILSLIFVSLLAMLLLFLGDTQQSLPEKAKKNFL